MRTQFLSSDPQRKLVTLASAGRGMTRRTADRRDQISRHAAGDRTIFRRAPRRKSWLTIAVLTVGALLLGACHWPQFRYGPDHSGYNPTESKIGVGNVGTLTEKWTALTGGAVDSSAAVVKGVVYVGSDDHNLYAFDADGDVNCSGTPKTCAPLWTATTGGAINSSPAVVNGAVYVGSDDHNLYAFDAHAVVNCSGLPKTCAPLWTATTGGAVDSSPAVTHGVVFVSTADDKLEAFDAAGTAGCSSPPKTCAPLWTGVLTGTTATGSSPAVVNGVVYVESSTRGGCGFICIPSFGTNNAFDAAGVKGCSGVPRVCTPLWSQGYVGVPNASPAVAKGVVYINPTYNNLDAFDASGMLWIGGSIEPGSGSNSSPAVANGVVYVGSANDNLYAFDAAGATGCSGTPKTCAPLWTATTGGSINSSPTVANGVIYVGSADDKLHAFGLP